MLIEVYGTAVIAVAVVTYLACRYVVRKIISEISKP
jgi:hypothetical protein